VCIVALVKERNEAAGRLAARIDPLTGVANRTAFFDAAERILERCRRDSAPVAVMMFDLDRFKAINDMHGHATGDAVLRAFAASTRGVLRQNDFFGRHGGEEFAVILPGADPARAREAAEMLRQAVEARRIPHGNSDAGPCVTLSLGFVSAKVTAETTPAWFIRSADEGLYRSKADGRNRATSIA